MLPSSANTPPRSVDGVSLVAWLISNCRDSVMTSKSLRKTKANPSPNAQTKNTGRKIHNKHLSGLDNETNRRKASSSCVHSGTRVLDPAQECWIQYYSRIPAPSSSQNKYLGPRYTRYNQNIKKILIPGNQVSDVIHNLPHAILVSYVAL